MNRFAEKRMKMASSIAHSREMIRRGYHPEFFKGVLIKLQTKQSNILRQERLEQAIAKAKGNS